MKKKLNYASYLSLTLRGTDKDYTAINSLKMMVLAAIFIFGQHSQILAQVANYTFAQSSGTYIAITGGTVMGTTTSDDQNFVDPSVTAGSSGTSTGVGLPIGFNFQYNGQVHDRFAINNNGWISLGNATNTPAVSITTSYVPLSVAITTTPAFLRNRIAVLSRDLTAQTGAELRYQTLGTSPNRTLVIQWKNYRTFGATGDNFNFQIRLNETTNTVVFVYGTFIKNATSRTTQIGLGGTTNADFNNRATTTDWSATTAGATNAVTCTISNTVSPTSGLTFTWSPPVPCSGIPTAGTASTSSNTICSLGSTVSLSLAGYTTDLGITFQWQLSTDGGSMWSNIAGATTNPATVTVNNATNKYRCIVTCTSSSLSATSSVVDVQIFTAQTAPWYEGFESTTGSLLPNCWSKNTSDFVSNTGIQSQNRSPRIGNRYVHTQQSTVAGTGDWMFASATQLLAGTTYQFSFWYKVDGTTGFDVLQVGVGTTQNAAGMTIILGTPLNNITNTTYQLYQVTFTPTVTDNYYFGVNVVAGVNPWYISFDDFALEEMTNCTSTPIGGTSASSSTNLCSVGNTVNLSLTGHTSSSIGITYQWQLSTDGGSMWSNIAGATTNPVTVTVNNVINKYRCIVTCTNSSLSANSSVVDVLAGTPQGDTAIDPIIVNTLPYTNSGNTANCFTNTIGNTAPDVWYKVSTNMMCNLSVSLCSGTTYDSYLRIYDADGTTQLAFNDDGCGAQSVISNLDVSGRSFVYVVVEGFGANTGTYVINITGLLAPTINLGTIADVSNSATSFDIPFTAITGSPNVYTLLAGTRVLGGFTTLTDVAFTSSPISINIPASADGTYDFNLRVKNTTTGCVSAVVPFTLTVTPPTTITSFLPTSGGVDTQVTITGTNFTGATAVTIGGVAARSFVVVNSTTIIAIINDGFATGVITVTKGGVATSATNFTRTSCTNTVSITSVIATTSIDFAGFDVVWDLGANTYTQINVYYQPVSGAGSTYFTRRTFAGNATGGRLWTVNGNGEMYNIYVQGVCNGNAERVNTTAMTIAASAGTNKPCSIITLASTPLAVSGTSITFTWNTVPNAYLYQPVYQECDANGLRVAGGGQGGTAYLTPATHPNTQSWTASQLKPNTFYRFSVRVHCLQGNSDIISPYSLYPFIQTGGSGITCLAPSPTLGAAGTTNGYASQVINWAAVPSATNGYGINFRESTQPNWTTYHLGNVTSYTISGLKQGANYTYFVYGACSNGQAPRSADGTFVAGAATLDCNAATPNASTPISTPPIGATLSWTTNPANAQAGKLYGIIYNAVGSPNTTYAVFTDNVSQTLSAATHAGIVANTNYTYTLQTYCDSRLQWVNNTGTFFVPVASGAEKNSPLPPTGG